MQATGQWRRKAWRWAAAVATFVVAATAWAAPFRPTDDAQVLERLPGGGTPQSTRLKSLQVAAAQAPNDLGRATALASAYIQASRVDGDPRFLGYAQAALAPWWQVPEAPSSVLMLRATILQSMHQFEPAIADLDRLSQREPKNAQALLTRATLRTVQGRYAPARADCERLRGLVSAFYLVACSATIDSVSGDTGAAYAALVQAFAALPRVDGATRAWVETLLGEIAHRRGDPAAERHFRAALDTGERDLYLLGAYSDWLLDRGRALEVVALLKNESRSDPLLLRLALAQKALQSPDAAASIETLRMRFDASHARGDTVHQRENARFELGLRGDARAALVLALANWQVQREPADLRILAQAATAAGDAAAIGIVQRWLAETRFEYPLVAALVNNKGAGK